MLLSAYAMIRCKGPIPPFIIDSEYIGVYVQTAYVSQQLQGELFIKHHTPRECSKDLHSCTVPMYSLAVIIHQGFMAMERNHL